MRRSSSRLVWVASVAALSTSIVIACSSSSTHPPNAGDLGGSHVTGGGDGAITDADTDGPLSSLTCTPADAGAGCNALGFCTGHINVSESGAVAPTMTGGTLPSGLYALTSYVIYTGGGDGGDVPTTGAWFMETMRFSTVDSGSDAGATDSGTSASDGGEGGTDSGTSTADAGSSTVTEWQNFISTNESPAAYAQTGVITYNGISLSIDATCPSAQSNVFSAQYTTTGNSLAWLTKDPKGMSLLTYEKISN